MYVNLATRLLNKKINKNGVDTCGITNFCFDRSNFSLGLLL